MGIPALPFSKLMETVSKPLGNKHVKEPKTLGEKLRNRRLELGLFQKDVAEILGVCTDTVTNWENNKTEPQIELYPEIIKLLG